MKRFDRINVILELAIILINITTIVIAISKYNSVVGVVAKENIATAKAESNRPIGRWVGLGLEGIIVGAIAVSPNYASDQTIFVNSSEGIFRSTNAGRTWVKLTSGLPDVNPNYDGINSSIVVSPNYAIDQTIFVNTPSSSDLISNGVYHSRDGGDNWERVNVEFGESVVPQITFSPNYKNDHTIFIGGDGDVPGNGFLAKSTNNGLSWQIINPLPSYSSWFISDFAFSPNYVTDQTIFATVTLENNFGGIIKSVNGGIAWTLSIPYDQGPSNAWAIAVSPNYSRDQTVFVGTEATNEGRNLIRSIDGGVTWQIASIGLQTDDVQDIVIASDSTLYAGTGGGGVLISNNFGGSWQQLNDFPINSSCGSFYSLAFSPEYIKDGTLFAACAYPFYKENNDPVPGVWKHVITKQYEPPGQSKNNSILSPFNNGVTWSVYNGYLDNRDQSWAGCGVAFRALDHCRNQLFGLDLVPDQEIGFQILAPANGTIIWKGRLEGGCVGVRIRLDNGLNMNVCHFATFNVEEGKHVARGAILGTSSTQHVHMSLDDRYGSGNLCPGAKDEVCNIPVPFSGVYTIEGISFDPNPNGETVILPYPKCDKNKVVCQFNVDFQQYRGFKGTSTNRAIP